MYTSAANVIDRLPWMGSFDSLARSMYNENLFENQKNQKHEGIFRVVFCCRKHTKLFIHKKVKKKIMNDEKK